MRYFELKEAIYADRALTSDELIEILKMHDLNYPMRRIASFVLSQKFRRAMRAKIKEKAPNEHRAMQNHALCRALRNV